MDIINLSKGLYSTVGYVIKINSLIIASHGTYEYTKFGFYVMEKMGIMEVVSNSIKKRYHVSPTLVIIEITEEKSELGSFEIVDVS